MGDFVGGRLGLTRARLESVLCVGHLARRHLRTSDHCHYAAKRRGGGSGGSLRRSGQPNCVRSARCGHVSFQGHNLVRHHVHAHVDGVNHASELDCGVGGQLRIATILEDVKAGDSRGSNSNGSGVSSGPGNSSTGSARAVEISKTVQNSAADFWPRNAKFVQLTSCGSGGTGRRTILRGWRRKAWGFESPLPHQSSPSIFIRLIFLRATVKVAVARVPSPNAHVWTLRDSRWQLAVSPQCATQSASAMPRVSRDGYRRERL
jgi:hypothetical protein